MNRRRWGAVVLTAVAIAWLPLNERVEGPTLITLSETHGITAADLISVGLVLVAGWLWFG